MEIREEISPAKSRRDLAKRRGRLAKEVRRYVVDVLPRLERSMEVPETPVRTRWRGSSNPPMPDSAHALMDANRLLADTIRRDLRDLETRYAAYKGVEFRDILRELREVPGLEKRWKDSTSKEDQLKYQALWRMCLLLAEEALRRDQFLTPADFYAETSLKRAKERFPVPA